jgi:DNA-binding CsgD family transcriptional regulator
VQEIYATESAQQIALLHAIYDTENKNAEILRLNAIRKGNFILIVSLISASLLAGLLAYSRLSRQKAQKELIASDLKRKQLEEDNLRIQLEQKSRELSSHILHLMQKNETLEVVKKSITEMVNDEKRDQKKPLKHLLQTINFSYSRDEYWNEFRLIFDKVHPSFQVEMMRKHADLTASELRLLSLLKMNLSTSDISTLLGVTGDSLRVMRYRVKKKLGLGVDESLSAFVHSV